MDIGTDERASMTEGTTMAEKLDREQGGRGAAQTGDERSNLPVDVPKPVSTFPVGYEIEGGAAKPGEFWTKPVRGDEEEIARVGRREWLDAVMGGPDFEAKTDEERAADLKENWLEAFGKDKEFPYNFSDPGTGSIEMELCERVLQERLLEELRENPWDKWETIDVANEKWPVEAVIDLEGIRDRRVKKALEHLGGEKFVREVWANATKLVLAAERGEPGVDWPIKVIKLETKPDSGKERGKSMVMSLADLQRMLYVDEDYERKQVELPDIRKETVGGLDLIRALYKIKIGGQSLPEKIEIEEVLLR